MTQKKPALGLDPRVEAGFPTSPLRIRLAAFDAERTFIASEC
jgi:hypothetical protein